MSIKKLITFLTLIGATACLNVYAECALDQKEAEKMAKNLRKAHTAEDSIKILYDVYALSDRDHKKDVGMSILEIAQRTDNKDVKVDMLNRLASKIEDGEGLSKLMEISGSLPADSTRRAVELLLEMEEARNLANNAKGEDLNKKIREYALLELQDKTNIYDEILDLYRAMVYLGSTSQGSLYLEYITRLGDLVKRLPEEDFAIRNLYLTTAAIYYTRNRNYEKAIESDKELLKEIEKLKKNKSNIDGQYQNFDYSTYISYRRMLANYPALSKEEVEEIYARCQELAETNEDVAKEFGHRGLSKSFYNMALHNYKEAVPALREALSTPDISLFRKRELLANLVQALDSIGDRNGQFEAMKEYMQVAEEYRNQHAQDAERELRVRTDVNRMAHEQRMEAEKIAEENRQMRKVAITLVYALGIALIFLCGNYFRLRQKVKLLAKQNRGLHHNIQNIFDDGTPIGTHDPRIQRGNLKG